MNHVSFHGVSDDLIEVGGTVHGTDEYPGEKATFEVAGLRVSVTYTPTGTWAISVGQIDEAIPVTAENIALSVAGYSMVLDLDVPAGAYISKVG